MTKKKQIIKAYKKGATQGDIFKWIPSATLYRHTTREERQEARKWFKKKLYNDLIDIFGTKEEKKMKKSLSEAIIDNIFS